MDTKRMISWIKTHLLPSLKPNNVVIMDNAKFHKPKEIRELIESANCFLLYLPPYSPDLNPIEKFWAKLKNKVKRIFPSITCLTSSIDAALSLP